LSVTTYMHRPSQHAAVMLSSCMASQSSLDIHIAGQGGGDSILHAATAVLEALHGPVSVAKPWRTLAPAQAPGPIRCKVEKLGAVSFSNCCPHHEQDIAAVASLCQLLPRALGSVP
jgi:hypothetical protein